MRISFRQGIVGHQTGGFLTFNGSGNVSLLTNNKSTTVSVAHNQTNYTHTEYNSVDGAWVGPFSATSTYWLYWDFSPLTFERTFGHTTLEPIAQSTEPGSGNSSIINVTTGAPGIGSFVVDGEFILPIGRTITVIGSTGNDGIYNVALASYNGTSGETTIVVNQTVADSTPDGEITLDVDSGGLPLQTVGRHWFDTENHRHYVWQGSSWSEVLRVFAARVINGTTFLPYTIGAGLFTGTQIGDTSSVRTGRVLFDESAQPIIRDDGTFFTTENQMFVGSARTDAVRLESNVARAQFPDNSAIAAFHVVTWHGDGKARLAQYNDIGSSVVGILTEDVLINEIGSVIIQGVVTNPNWDWTTGTSPVPVGTPLWCNDIGELISDDPHVTDLTAYPEGMVPIARVLSDDTVIFEQGLGGKGDVGPPGTIVTYSPATTTEIGAVRLTVDSSDLLEPYVVSDLDPRLTNARTPLPHTHPANEVTYTAGGGLSSTNVQDALTELGNTKFNISGGTLTGFLTLNADPTNPLHSATKQYVDGLVSGLVWLDPICLVNLISDVETAPPGSPEFSDAYIIPAGGGSGAWSVITPLHIVVWDGTSWLDRGLITDINPGGARLGISMTSTTIAGGSFVGQDNNIAIYDGTGALTGFEVPTDSNAVYVCSTSSLHSFNQFAFSGTDWILFGGGSALTADGVTTVQVGNVLSVKQWADGGEVDTKFWQGLEPSDLSTVYAPFTHTHPATAITNSTYIASPDWGMPVNIPSIQLNSTNVQASLQELVDEKALKTPLYANLTDLPSPASVEGMIVYVQNEGNVYVAQSSSWVAIENSSSFLDLTDTPSSYTSHSGKYVKVGPGSPPTGLEFECLPDEHHTIVVNVSGSPSDGETILRFRTSEEFKVEAAGHQGYADVADPSNNLIITISRVPSETSTPVSIGTVVFVTGTNWTTGTLTETDFNVGDLLIIEVGTVNTWADFTISINSSISRCT